ncbi:MAG TPA: UbiA family prenyltransferase [Chloroflexota bacterium]|nr:UbiA family prenyltransferase [Chloroflexota bacterium]
MADATSLITRPRPAFGLQAAIATARPRQWLKNGLVLAALVYAGRLTTTGDVARAGLAFLVFCLISSSGYVLNDVVDAASDTNHPFKRSRPIPAGTLGTREALIFGSSMALAGLAVALALGPAFEAVSAAYLALSALYSVILKHRAGLDILTICGLFELRALAGAVAIGVAESIWLAVMTALLAAFLVVGKRRAELGVFGLNSAGARRSLQGYSTVILDGLTAVVAVGAAACYCAYCLLARGLPPHHLMLPTLPFVVVGLARYARLTGPGMRGPEDGFLRDRLLLIDVAMWAVLTAGLLYWAR